MSAHSHHEHGGHHGGWLSRWFSQDHKVIAKQYIITAAVMALIGVTLSVLIRLQVTWPAQQWPVLQSIFPGLYQEGVLLPERYISLVTMHGTLMIFFVISIALVSGLGNFIIPLQIGARDMAYPFLNMLSYWTLVPACLIMIASFFVPDGPAAAGWTAYPPLSALPEAVPGSGMGQTLWLLAMVLFIASFTMGGLNFFTTVLNMRTAGMSLMRMPIATWTMFIAAGLGIIAFPAITAAAIMLLFDRTGGTSFFLPDGLVLGGQVAAHSGGTPLLFQHLFWFFGHPEVYILVLPAVGVAFETITAFARRPAFGYRLVVWALMGVVGLSMIVWGHHMFTSGMNPFIGEYFSIVTVAISLPFSLLIVSLVATLWRSEVRLTTSMLFALALLAAVALGGLGGIWLATQTADAYLHDSYFVVGHFHLMIAVVTFFGLYSALYYWYPKMFGAMMSETLGKIHFWLSAGPTIAAFMGMHFIGLGGVLRRTYDPGFYEFAKPHQDMNLWITGALLIAGAAQILFLVNFVGSWFKKKDAPENPWEATTIEWTTPSPAPHLNWPDKDTPTVYRGPYDYRVPEAPDGYMPQHVPVGGTPAKTAT